MTGALPGRHTPLRPIWLCRVDANPWPCGEAKLALLARYGDDLPGLLALLTGLSAEATEHLTQLDNGRRIDVTDRFLTWVRPPDR
ncbi:MULTISPECIES: flavin reductase [Micromonospora]|uniref:Flavin reductase n=1 Tax=Micromonospora humida TaxID=2809018 RepID=A0ABS2ITA4_9ACTN|nr:flavin reductase [Micromonospora humida]MBM7077518.1 flavin reductase [Micromonospora humida]